MLSPETKIFLDKTDNLVTAVDKIIKAAAETVVLNIPKNSLLGENLHNFQVLKRESATAHKELLVESVDDHVLELAGLCSIRAVNPVFKTRERSVSDIVPRGTLPKKMPALVKAELKEEKTEEPKIEKFFEEHEVKKEAPAVIGEIKKTEINRLKGEKPKRKFVLRRSVWFLILIIFVGLVYLLTTQILPKATIVITLKKNIVNFNETVKVATTTKEIDTSTPNVIGLPGELLVTEKNLTMQFPASGTSTVQVKATGTLWIYNAYNSSPQTLVKTTRFQSPDGKIFRLISQVTVPGAKIAGGKIQPSKIMAAVIADRAGADYNLPPTTDWKIPGFNGTPRYQGFYAESLLPMTGGFVGVEAVPNASDILKATTSIESSLAGILQSQMAVMLPQQFKLFGNAKSLKIIKETVQGGAADSQKFSVTVVGEMRELVFDEQMFQKAVVSQASSNLPSGLVVNSFVNNYGTPQINLANGQMIFNASGTVTLVANFDPNGFKKGAAGKDEATLRNLVFNLPGLEKGTISLWPFWVTSAPQNQAKIDVIVN